MGVGVSLYNYRCKNCNVKISENSILIPLSIFKRDIGILEALVKYLKEEINFSLKEISFYLKRDNKALWSTYNKAKKKNQIIEESSHQVQVTLSYFKNSNLTAFENLVFNLHNIENKSFCEMSQLLDRNYQTIWTTYKRAKEKSEK